MDIEIIEMYYNFKKDILSGMVLSLYEICVKVRGYDEKNVLIIYREGLRFKESIGIVVLRGGDVVGKYMIGFYLEGEYIEFSYMVIN